MTASCTGPSLVSVVGEPGSITTKLKVATTPSAEHRYTPPSSTAGVGIRSTLPSGVLGRGRPSSRDHVTMTARDTLHTSTTVCPAVMVAGPSMVTLGGGAVRGGRGEGGRGGGGRGGEVKGKNINKQLLSEVVRVVKG